jgi:hypothetical protein
MVDLKFPASLNIFISLLNYMPMSKNLQKATNVFKFIESVYVFILSKVGFLPVIYADLQQYIYA